EPETDSVPDTRIGLDNDPAPAHSRNASAIMCELGSPDAASRGGTMPSGTPSSPGSPGAPARARLPTDGPLPEGAAAAAGREGRPIRTRPIHSSAPAGNGETRIRSPFTTTPRPERSTTHSPFGVSTRPQW